MVFWVVTPYSLEGSPDVLEEHTASSFRVEVLRLKNWLYEEMGRACRIHGEEECM
jgi:hypothetical protein